MSDRLTPAELAEGQRLLERLRNSGYSSSYREDFADWCESHGAKMLSADADAEAVKREAVREFAEAILGVIDKGISWNRKAARSYSRTPVENSHAMAAAALETARSRIADLIAARGVTLESEGGA